MKTNLYFWVVLAAVVGFWLLDLVANWLNLRSLKPSLPEAFKGIYDEAEYRRMIDYTRTRTRFEAAESSFMLLVFLLFWFLGGYPWLDEVVRSFNLNPIITGLIFFGALALGQGVIGLPFSIYSTFGIEQRFGFNKTTPKTFLADLIKGVVLGSLLGGGLLAMLLWLLQFSSFWVYAWIATALVMLLLSFLAPAVILPLFNKFTPLPEGALRRAILAYADAQQFPVGGLYVMDGSKRSSKANAFFTGLGKTKKIALFDTLIESFMGKGASEEKPSEVEAEESRKGVEELVAVLAHEIGHFKHRHVPQHMATAILKMGLFFFLAQYCVEAPGLFAAFGIESGSAYIGLALFLLLFKPVSALTSVLEGIQSRRHEYQADRFAATTTGNPEAMIAALKKLSRNNLANLSPHPLYVALYHSHPPLIQRIEALRGLGAMG
jgi:STE24 endopeptidase